MNTNDLIVVAGGGGFIAGSLVRYFTRKGFTRIRAVDKKPLPLWYQRVPGVECLSLDLSQEENCRRAVEGAAEVYNLAADMGGMGFIERNRVDCLRSVLINTHMVESAYRAGVERYFFSSSACAYNTDLQKDPHVRALKESDAYPAMAERGYGWEKLISEMFCQEYWAERGMKTFMARFHNVYGPTARGTGAGRRRRPRCAARSSRRRTRGAGKSRSGATARRRAASCTSTIAPGDRQDHALREARGDADQSRLLGAGLDQRAGEHRGESGGREAAQATT